jgi:hypothetical protein
LKIDKADTAEGYFNLETRMPVWSNWGAVASFEEVATQVDDRALRKTVICSRTVGIGPARRI